MQTAKTATTAEFDEPEVFSDEEIIDYTEDSFDKFLSNEESDLIK